MDLLIDINLSVRPILYDLILVRLREKSHTKKVKS